MDSKPQDQKSSESPNKYPRKNRIQVAEPDVQKDRDIIFKDLNEKNKNLLKYSIRAITGYDKNKYDESLDENQIYTLIADELQNEKV